jgi:hypothetical protein
MTPPAIVAFLRKLLRSTAPPFRLRCWLSPRHHVEHTGMDIRRSWTGNERDWDI